MKTLKNKIFFVPKKPKKFFKEILLIGLIICLFLISGCGEKFCGSSSFSSCLNDDDCLIGGCSGQICGGEKTISTCEYRDCYNAEKYGLSCGCVDDKCSWN